MNKYLKLLESCPAWSSCSVVMNPTSIHEDAAGPGLPQWVKDPALPWAVVADTACILHHYELWRRLATTALIWPLAWELPYTWSAILKKTPPPPKKNLPSLNIVVYTFNDIIIFTIKVLNIPFLDVIYIFSTKEWNMSWFENSCEKSTCPEIILLI